MRLRFNHFTFAKPAFLRQLGRPTATLSRGLCGILLGAAASFGVRPWVAVAAEATSSSATQTLPRIASEATSSDVEAARQDPRWSMTYVLEAERGKQATSAPGPVVSHSSWVQPQILVPTDSPDVPVGPAANRTQSEISVAIHPTNSNIMFVGTNTTNFPVTQVLGTGTYWSTNAGATWTGTDNPGGVVNRGDPAAVIGADGRFMIGFISSTGGMGIAYSTNTGATWAQRVVSAAGGLDKNHLMVDASSGSPFLGNYYNTWVNLGGGASVNDIEFSRSTNGGDNWSAPVNISNNILAGSHNQGCNNQVGPDGEVYVCWSVYDAFPADETAIGFNKSTNGGVTWIGESRKITGIRGHRNTALPNTTIRRNSFPSMAVDVSNGPNRGAIYIAWTNVGVPGVNTGTDTNIWLAKSTNGGTTFSTPTRINNDAGANSQWFPWISCDPVTGRLAVVFYDRRDDPANSLTRAYMATSGDGGITWDNFAVGDVSFTPAPIPGLAGGYMGDYLGIAANNGLALPSWTDNRSGNFLCYVSPISLVDGADPNPPTNVAALSDFSTPTSALLQWTDPTTNVDGSPLVDFSIDVLRDGLLVANVDQGVGAHVDGGLVDGQSYLYALRSRNDVTDSTSAAVEVSVTAGGSPTPRGPTAVTCVGGPTSANIGWTNPTQQVDGTRLDDFAGLRLYRNGTFLIELARAPSDTGSVDSYIDSPPPGTFYTYEVSAIDSETPVHESTRVAAPAQFVGQVPEILVWAPSASATTGPGLSIATSADSLVAALTSLGEYAVKVTDLFAFSSDLNVHEMVFGAVGVTPNTHTITTTEGTALDDFVQDGGRLYLEGSDCFNTATGYNVRPIFSLNVGNTGAADLINVSGLGDLAAFQFTYGGPNNSIDRLVPIQSTVLFRNTTTLNNVTVFNAPYGLGRSIGAAYEFGGLSSPTITKASLMAAYLRLLRDNGDPNPPAAFSAFSDYQTPTSVLLSWTDPTTYVTGGALVDFSIDILRNGALVGNVNQGVGSFTDPGRVDGQSYIYAIRAHDDVTDSLSTAVSDTVFAGGSPTPAAPTAVSAVGGPTQASIGWTNPTLQTDGTKLDDFAGVRLYRNGVFLVQLARAAADTGSVDSYIDTPPAGALYTYEVAAIDTETPVHESARVTSPQVFVGSTPSILVWKASNFTSSSADSIVAALVARGESPVLTSNLFFFSPDLNAHQIIFACAGVNPQKHIISAAEGAALDDFVQDGGGLYLEGADCFNTDTSFGGYNVRTMFGLNLGGTGSADLFSMNGSNDLAGFQFGYAGPNSGIDDLVPVQSTAVLRNATTNDVVTVFRNGYFLGRAIGAAYEFGGLTSTTQTKANLVAAYLAFFRSTGAPNMVVSTNALSATVQQTQSANVNFAISNPGTPNSALNYTIAESPVVSWLTATPTSGSIAANGLASIAVALNSTGLPPGVATTKLIVTGNSPSTPADTVDVTLTVTAIPVLTLTPPQLFVTVPVGGTLNETIQLQNTGVGSINYTLDIIGVGGDDSDEMIDGLISAAQPTGYAGNVFSVTTGVPITSIEQEFSTTGPTQLEFFVYEKPLTGTQWKKIASKSVVSGVGLALHSSGPMNALLRPAREYFIGCGWASAVTGRRDDGTNVPDNVNFGTITRSFQGTAFPPPDSVAVGTSPFVWNQVIRYGIPVDVDILSPVAGTVGAGETDVIDLRIRNADQEGAYTAFLNVFHNAPFAIATGVPINIGVGQPPTDVEPVLPALPTKFALYTPTPNPFREGTSIRFDLPQEANVRLAIYDISGRLVHVMREGAVPAGTYTEQWAGRNTAGERVAPGVYFYSLEAGADVQRKKVVLLR